MGVYGVEFNMWFDTVFGDESFHAIYYTGINKQDLDNRHTKNLPKK